MPAPLVSQPPGGVRSDEDLLVEIRGGDVSHFAVLVRRYNQQLYRAARSIVRDDQEAEDVVQQAWVSAFEHLHQFAGGARFSTWVTRIAVNEALARRRAAGRPLHAVADDAPIATPEETVSRAELSGVLSDAIDALPEGHRTVFVLREVQELSTAETAEVLGMGEEAVRVRLLRARRRLRALLLERAGLHAAEIFRFDGERCDRIVAAVMRLVGRRREPLG